MAQTIDSPEKILETAKAKFAPDDRTAIFDIRFDAQTKVLSGKTTDAQAIVYVTEHFNQIGTAYHNEVRVLPDETRGIINVSVANIRSKPSHAAELSTQALLGTIVKIWDYQPGWYQIQTPDRYIGWVDAGGISKFDIEKSGKWDIVPKIIYLNPYGFCYSRADSKSQTVSDLVLGNELMYLGESEQFWNVQFPDGRSGYVKKNAAQFYATWVKEAVVSEKTLLATAMKLIGIPYLWGGTSSKGMDCSGFTKTVYLANGWVLPRDASQQIYSGDPIELSAGFSDLKPGDLLFFGTPGSETSSEKITHVAMWLGENKFVHASGFIRINSTDPASVDYDEFNTKRFVRAKRLIGSSNGVIRLSVSKEK